MKKLKSVADALSLPVGALDVTYDEDRMQKEELVKTDEVAECARLILEKDVRGVTFYTQAGVVAFATLLDWDKRGALTTKCGWTEGKCEVAHASRRKSSRANAGWHYLSFQQVFGRVGGVPYGS